MAESFVNVELFDASTLDASSHGQNGGGENVKIIRKPCLHI